MVSKSFLKLEICAEKIVFNCSTLKKNRLLFVTFKKQRRRERVKLHERPGFRLLTSFMSNIAIC